MLKLFISIVTYHSEGELFECLRSLQLLSTESSLISHVAILENSGNHQLISEIKAEFGERVSASASPTGNIGFAAGHNALAAEFLKSDSEYLLVLNPDLSISPAALRELIARLESDARIGLTTPLLLRAKERAGRAVIDAAGMILNSSLRHLDRGSDELWQEQYKQEELVFGGTGACLLLKRSCVQDLLLRGSKHDSDLLALFPQLAAGLADRAPLFDEAFFAYREDADLCWRAGLLGWRCLFVPQAVGLHVRRVTPERRAELPAEINRHSVRNRFLLQINNWFLPRAGFQTLFAGILWRNLLVVLGVLLKERSSMAAFKELWQLRKRQFERRQILAARLAN